MRFVYRLEKYFNKIDRKKKNNNKTVKVGFFVVVIVIQPHMT